MKKIEIRIPKFIVIIQLVLGIIFFSIWFFLVSQMPRPYSILFLIIGIAMALSSFIVSIYVLVTGRAPYWLKLKR